MQIVITMAGLGERFKKAGYSEPKYEIKAHGRTLFSWSMESLSDFFDGSDIFFIVRREDNAADFIRKEAALYVPEESIKVIELDEPTDGQATTAKLAAPYWKKDDELLIYNIDTYVKKGGMLRKDIEGDGFIPCFKAPGDHWSFVLTDDAGDAIEVREKQRISDNCTLGAYYFSSCGLYERMYESYYGSGANLEKGEKYVAPLYNHMIKLGMKVRISLVDKKYVHVLGTPEELEAFKDTRI